MRLIFVIVLLGVLAIGGYMFYTVRTVTHNPTVWHVEPLEVEPSVTPNDFRVAPSEFTPHFVQLEAPVYEADAATLAEAFDRFVMAQPRVERVAGTVGEAWITYVQRTDVLQLPDYISVRFYDLDPPEPEQAPAPEPENATPSAVVIEGLDQPAPAPSPTPVVEPTPATPNATIAIYSRSRFGHGDMGVNEKRVRNWLTALRSFEKN